MTSSSEPSLNLPMLDGGSMLGDNHPDTLMANLAFTYWNQGRWEEAEALNVVVLERRKLVLGEDHPDTLNSMEDLATIYREQGRLDEAEALG